MFDRTIGLDPRPAAPQSRAIYRSGTAIAENTTRVGTAGPPPSANGAVGRSPTSASTAPSRTAISPRLTSAAIPTPRGGGERLDTRRARQGVHGQGTEGNAVQGTDAHAQGSGRHPRRGGRAGPGPRTAHQVRPPAASNTPSSRTTRPSTGPAAANANACSSGAPPSGASGSTASSRALSRAGASPRVQETVAGPRTPSGTRPPGSWSSPSDAQDACSTPMRRSSTPTPTGGARKVKIFGRAADP